MRCLASLLAITSLVVALSGCGPSTPSKPPVVDTHEEDHHHPGPHGGIVAAVGDKHQYHIEWTHDHDDNAVTFIVLDANKSKEVPIAMEKLEIVIDGKPYTLEAVNPQDGKASQFEIQDADLLLAVEDLGGKVKGEVKELDVNGEKFSNVKLVEDHSEHD